MDKQEQFFLMGYLVHDVSRLRRTVFDKALKHLRVTRSQWWVLGSLLRHNGRGLMQTELANVLDVGKVTLGGLIDRLEARGYVERQPDPHDRRAKRVVITASGMKLVSRIQNVTNGVDDVIMGGIPPGDVVRTEMVLRMMKQRLIAMDAVPGASNNKDVSDAKSARRGATKYRSRLTSREQSIRWRRSDDRST